MFKYLLANLSDTPKEVNFKDISEFDRMEQRFFDSVEFCPNHNPPELQNEILPWLWLIHPELKDQISEIADSQLRQIIREYRNHKEP